MWWWRSAQVSATVPSAEEVRAQLASILASHRFQKTAIGKLFLSYLVERTLEGDSEALEEKAIAIKVFRRGDSFDPRTDPAVRVAAQWLRRLLKRYYSSRRHRNAPVLIELPKDAFTPVFGRPQAAAPLLRQPVFWTVLALAVISVCWMAVRTGVFRGTYHSVAVLPIANVNGPHETDLYAAKLADHIAAGLAKTGGLRVAARPTAFERPIERVEPAVARDLARGLSVDALLEGSVYPHDGEVRIWLQLVDGRDGLPLWTDVWVGREAQTPAMEGDIVRAVARTLAATARR